MAWHRWCRQGCVTGQTGDHIGVGNRQLRMPASAVWTTQNSFPAGSTTMVQWWVWKVLAPQDARAESSQPLRGFPLVGHSHVEMRPVLAGLGFGHLLQEIRGLGTAGITQDRVVLLAVVQLVAERRTPTRSLRPGCCRSRGSAGRGTGPSRDATRLERPAFEVFPRRFGFEGQSGRGEEPNSVNRGSVRRSVAGSAGHVAQLNSVSMARPAQVQGPASGSGKVDV